MHKFITLSIAILFLLSAYSNSQSLSGGSLVIVGGGLEPTNKSIFNHLISLAGGAEEAAIAVIPSASGTPMQSYVYFRNILISYGLKPENIFLVPVAIMDDDSTMDVNESEWKDNGNNTGIAELVRKCSGVWFSGGDQARTMKTLVNRDGSKTRVLEAVWDVYRNGGVVGGTSAGAAIMSEVMIGGGSSIAALTRGVIRNFTGDDFPDSLGVMVSGGLGFFPYGLVDQHFNARARIGRLAVTLMNDKKIPMGFGVDENTALIFNSKQNMMQVAGAAGVTILNPSNARLAYVQQLPVIENLNLCYLEEGDTYDFTTGTAKPAAGKQSTKGKEHYSEPYPGQLGILSSYAPGFRDLYTEYLADNKVPDTIQNITFISPTRGFRLSLFKTKDSEGFCTEKSRHDYRYTVLNIGMDIIPVQISATPINHN